MGQIFAPWAARQPAAELHDLGTTDKIIVHHVSEFT
jgi:hypothetical protein